MSLLQELRDNENQLQQLTAEIDGLLRRECQIDDRKQRLKNKLAKLEHTVNNIRLREQGAPSPRSSPYNSPPRPQHVRTQPPRGVYDDRSWQPAFPEPQYCTNTSPYGMGSPATTYQAPNQYSPRPQIQYGGNPPMYGPFSSAPYQ